MSSVIKPTILLLVAFIFGGVSQFLMKILGIDIAYSVLIVGVSYIIGLIVGMFAANYVYDKLRIWKQKRRDKRTHLSLMLALLLISSMFVSCENSPRKVTIIKPHNDSIFIVSVVYNSNMIFGAEEIQFDFYVQADDRYDADRMFNNKIDINNIESYTIKKYPIWK